MKWSPFPVLVLWVCCCLAIGATFARPQGDTKETKPREKMIEHATDNTKELEELQRLTAELLAKLRKGNTDGKPDK